MEQVISVVGLLALLGLAFAFSNNHRAINPRTLIWGMSLQMLFAVIILKDGYVSFAGMFALVFLIVLYLVEGELEARNGSAPAGLGSVGFATLIAYAAGVATFSYEFDASIFVATAYSLGAFILVLLVALAITARGLSSINVGTVAIVIETLAGGGIAVAVLVYYLAPLKITSWALTIVALVWLASFFLRGQIRSRLPHLTRYAFVGVLIVGLAQMISSGIDGRTAFSAASGKVAEFLALSNDGAFFLFGNLSVPVHFFPGEDAAWPGFAYQFAFLVLPTIIFFSAFMSVLYYLGVVQVVVQAMARFMRWSLRTSGSETLSCSANIFVGQTEAPFLIKPFLKDMTASELHAVMTSGFATIAGGVLAAYIGMGINPTHLIAASVMSAPAALVIAKLLYPETEESVTAGDVDIPEVKTAGNVVEAAAEGTTDGLKLALNVGAMLIAFIALVAFLDWVLAFGDYWVDHRAFGIAEQVKGEYRGWFPGSMSTLFGTILAPLAFVMGVPWSDAAAVGNLLGTKITINEFVAYGFLSEHINAEPGSVMELSERSQIIATYALCGFANFSSIGIQIGGISALEPSLRPTLAKIAIRALFGGALASFTTATVAGMLL